MKCKNCGTEIGKGIKFCPNCGNKIQKQCPMCGQEIEEGMKFCVSCGAKLLDDEAVNNNVYATEQKAESTKAQEETTRPEVTKSVHRTNTSFMQELDALAEKDKNTKAVISWVGKGYLQKWFLPFLRDDEQIVSFWHIQHKKLFLGRLDREFVVLTTRRVICFVKRQYMKSQIKSCSLKDILSVDTADQESNAIYGTLIGEKINVVASNGTISVRMVGKGQAKELKQAIEFLIGQADLVKDFVGQSVNGINVQKGKRSTFDIVAIILTALLLVLLGVYLFSPTKSMTTATPPTIPTTTATPTNDLSSLFDADTNELKSFIDNESLSYDGENRYSNDDIVLELENGKFLSIQLYSSKFTIFGISVGDEFDQSEIEKAIGSQYTLIYSEEGFFGYGILEAGNDKAVVVEYDPLNNQIRRIAYSKSGALDIQKAIESEQSQTELPDYTETAGYSEPEVVDHSESETVIQADGDNLDLIPGYYVNANGDSSISLEMYSSPEDQIVGSIDCDYGYGHELYMLVEDASSVYILVNSRGNEAGYICMIDETSAEFEVFGEKEIYYLQEKYVS